MSRRVDRPTIEELEKILDAPDDGQKIHINPDGSIGTRLGTGIGPLQIVRRMVNPNRDDLSFSVEIAPPADSHDIAAFKSNINAVLDVIGEVAVREQLKSDLAERRKAQKAAREQLPQFDKDIELLRAQRMAYLSSREAMHNRSGRRLEFKVTDKHQADLDKFDAQLAQAELARKNFIRDAPIIEWEIACLVARINGEDEPPAPPELEAALAEMSLAA